MAPKNSRSTEHADPHEQYNPVPRVVLGLVLALIVWAVSYIVMQRPDGAAALGDRRVPATLAQVGAPGQAAAVDGRQLFTGNCQACHQATGQGLPGVFPPLAGSEWVTGDAQLLTQIVLHGLNGKIEVRGSSFEGAMPGFGAQLGNAEIVAVLSFIRSEWGNGAAAIDAQAVEAARQAFAGRSQPWNGADELQRAVSAALKR
jgi:mono/diheme cytochrome c family protein